MNTIYIITLICLAAVIAVLEILHFIERRDLCDRLMSRDLSEYKRERSPSAPEPPRESAHRRAINQWRSAGGESERRS